MYLCGAGRLTFSGPTGIVQLIDCVDHIIRLSEHRTSIESECRLFWNIAFCYNELEPDQRVRQRPVDT